MYRAFSLSIAHLTDHKRRVIAALLESYRGAVNFFIRSVWADGGKLDKPTLARLKSTRLSERYKSQALKQALELVVATKKSAKELDVTASCPRFAGSAELDAKFVDVEEFKDPKTFDLAVRLSTLAKGERIVLPLKATTPLRECLAKPGVRLVQGANVSEDRITLLVELPDVEPRPSAETDVVLGIDIGYHKLIATSRGEFLGTDFKEISNRIRRRKPGSKGKKRALKQRDQAVGEAVNKLPWDELDVVALEDLKGIKKGKRKGQTKAWRRKRASWPATAVTERVERRAAERAKRVIAVDPKDTSRRCPQCGHANAKNRVGAIFLCVKCGHMGDADFVGGLNVKTKAEAVLREERMGLRAMPVKKLKKKKHRRNVASRTTMAVAPEHKTTPGASGSPVCAPVSELRGTDHSRSDVPDTKGQGTGGAPVRGSTRALQVRHEPAELRSVESLRRRQPSDEIRRSG